MEFVMMLKTSADCSMLMCWCCDWEPIQFFFFYCRVYRW